MNKCNELGEMKLFIKQTLFSAAVLLARPEAFLFFVSFFFRSCFAVAASQHEFCFFQ